MKLVEHKKAVMFNANAICRVIESL